MPCSMLEVKTISCKNLNMLLKCNKLYLFDGRSYFKHHNKGVYLLTSKKIFIRDGVRCRKGLLVCVKNHAEHKRISFHRDFPILFFNHPHTHIVFFPNKVLNKKS